MISINKIKVRRFLSLYYIIISCSRKRRLVKEKPYALHRSTDPSIESEIFILCFYFIFHTTVLKIIVEKSSMHSKSQACMRIVAHFIITCIVFLIAAR